MDEAHIRNELQKAMVVAGVVPLSKEGKHDIENIVPACKSCNSKKHNTSLLLFLYGRLSC